MIEPTELEWAIMDRTNHALPAVGPLTAEQQQQLDAYERYQDESAAEYEAEQAAGGRTICDQCGERSVVHRTVCTLGYVGHPGADYSDLATCERCGWEDLA